MADDQASPHRVDRRTVIRRAGIVAGTTVWGTPVVQTLTAPAFATGTPEGRPGFAACLSGDGVLSTEIGVNDLAEPHSAMRYRITQDICCDTGLGAMTVVMVMESGEERTFVFDDQAGVWCHPQLTCSDCPSGMEATLYGRDPNGDRARLTISFTNDDPTTGQRGEPMDFGALSILTGDIDNDPAAHSAWGPSPDTEMSCDSC